MISPSKTIIPDWLARLMKGRDRPLTLDKHEVSVTTLLAPPWQTMLMDLHADELPERDPIDAIPSLVGTAWHEFVGNIDYEFPESAWIEASLSAPMVVDGEPWLVTGHPDYFNPSTGLLVDHKTTRKWSHVFGKREWEEQLNVYAWLIEARSIDVKQLQIHAVYLDWSAAEAARNHELPPRRLMVYDVDRWPTKDVEKFIESRIRQLQNPDLCSAEERWERGEHWAVMKKGRKSALKRCQSAGEAEAMVLEGSDDLYVEHRPGKPVRCLDWCPVREFCSFGKNLDGH